MSTELLKRLAMGLGALLVLWVAAEIIRGSPGDGVTEFALLELDADQPDSIVVTRAIGDVLLQRVSDDVWSVNGHRAAVTSVTEFLEALQGTARAELVAQNPSSFSRFDIEDDTARRLQVFNGSASVLDLLVGKRGADFQSSYVRRPNEDEVYVARFPIGTFVDRPLDDWRDKTIASLQPDAIAGIEVTRNDGSYNNVRADSGQWSIDGDPVDSAAVARLAGQFSSLNGTSFPSEVQMDSVDLASPDRRVVLRGADNTVLAELVFDSTAASGYWVRRVGDSTVLRLDRFRVDQLTPADSTLRN